jgi:hypothetical protein
VRVRASWKRAPARRPPLANWGACGEGPASTLQLIRRLDQERQHPTIRRSEVGKLDDDMQVPLVLDEIAERVA